MGTGRRRYIGWIGFAILAVVGGAALLSVGPFDGDDTGPSRPPATPLEKKAERVEQQSNKSPRDEELLLLTARRWIEAGNDRLNKIEFRQNPIPSVVPDDLKRGLEAWRKYLAATGGESPAHMAELAGYTYFQLVEIGSTDPAEAEANAAGAARALRIAAKKKHTLSTLSLLAINEYFNGGLAAGDRAARTAAATVKGGRDAIESRDVLEQLNEYKERGEKFVARVKKGFETLEESGEEELETPIKGYGAPAGINGYEPGTGPS